MIHDIAYTIINLINLYRSLQDLLDYNEPDLEQVFCLNFELSRHAFGETRVQELIPGGSKVPVTLENK